MAINETYATKYAGYALTDLLQIIDNPQDYQADAVETAIAELAKRNLSAETIELARAPLLAKKEAKRKQEQELKKMGNKLKNTGLQWLQDLNPIDTGVPFSEKAIRMIVLVFGIGVLYSLIKNFKLHWVNIKLIPVMPVLILTDYLPKLLLIAGLIWFWKRQKAGWVMLVIYLVYNCMATIWFLAEWFLIQQQQTDFHFRSLRPDYLSVFLNLFFFTGIILVLSKTSIRNIYRVNRETMILTILTSTAGTGLLIFALYNFL